MPDAGYYVLTKSSGLVQIILFIEYLRHSKNVGGRFFTNIESLRDSENVGGRLFLQILNTYGVLKSDRFF